MTGYSGLQALQKLRKRKGEAAASAGAGAPCSPARASLLCASAAGWPEGSPVPAATSRPAEPVSGGRHRPDGAEQPPCRPTGCHRSGPGARSPAQAHVPALRPWRGGSSFVFTVCDKQESRRRPIRQQHRRTAGGSEPRGSALQDPTCRVTDGRRTCFTGTVTPPPNPTALRMNHSLKRH